MATSNSTSTSTFPFPTLQPPKLEPSSIKSGKLEQHDTATTTTEDDVQFISQNPEIGDRVVSLSTERDDLEKSTSGVKINNISNDDEEMNGVVDHTDTIIEYQANSNPNPNPNPNPNSNSNPTSAIASSSKITIDNGDGDGDGIPKVNGARKGKGSCVYCRKRKQRCDPGPTPLDQCWPCKRLNRECIYPPGGIHTPRQSSSHANKSEKMDVVEGLGGSGSGKKPSSIKLTFSGVAGASTTDKTTTITTTSPSSSSVLHNSKLLTSPSMNHDIPTGYNGSIGYHPYSDHIAVFHPHSMSLSTPVGGRYHAVDGMSGGIGNGMTLPLGNGKEHGNEIGRKNRNKKVRREVDFTSDEDEESVDVVDVKENDGNKKRKSTSDKAEDDDDEDNDNDNDNDNDDDDDDDDEEIDKKESSRRLSLGDTHVQSPTTGGEHGTEASSELTSQASADGGKPSQNVDDDELMEAVGEDSTRSKAQTVSAEQDDEIDELMEEVDHSKMEKMEKGQLDDGKGNLEEEVEGELLMLADAEAPKRKRSHGSSSHRRTSSSAMYGTHPAQAAWHSPSMTGNRPVSSRQSMGNGHGHAGFARHRHAHAHAHAAAAYPGGLPPNGMMSAQTVASMGHPNGFSSFPPLDASPSFETLTPYATALNAIIPVLPPPATQQILFQTFFQDHFLAQGLTLLQPQYNNDFRDLLHRRSKVPPAPFRAGDATTLAVGFAILAVSLRIMPDETSQILLSSQNSNPRSLSRVLNGQGPSLNDSTPLHRRYVDHALIASQISDFEDPPSVMQVFLKLLLYRYGRLCATSPTVDPMTSQPRPPQLRDRLVLTGGWLSQGIKIAQAMGMNREWDGIPAVERELRRRVFWGLYVADRTHAFSTSFPYTIFDHHTTVSMPSPMSETDLYCLPTNIRKLPDHSTDDHPTSCTHLFIVAHLARLLTKLLDSFAINTPAGTSNDLVTQYDASLMQFEEALPSYFKFSPFTDTSRDSMEPFLPSHRVHIHSSIMSVRLSLHRPRLSQYLSPTESSTVRQYVVGLCLGMIRIQRNARMLESRLSFRLFDVERVFESTVILGLIIRVEKLLGMERNVTIAAGTTSTSRSTSTPPPGFSSEVIGNARSGLAEGIELLEGVQGWIDQSYLAGKALHVLRRMVAKNDSIRIDGGQVTESIENWLKTWRGTNVDMLMAEAEWRDWERIVEGI